MSSTERGRIGEAIAVQALESYGYVIVEHNWRCESGEIDIIARDGDVWTFVEVKTRQGERFGSPEEAVTEVKQARILEVAQLFLAGNQLDDVSWRVDVVAIELAPSNLVHRLTVYKDAVRFDA